MKSLIVAALILATPLLALAQDEQEEVLAKAQAELAQEVAAEQDAAAAALERADSLASVSAALAVQAKADEQAELPGVKVTVASRSPRGSRLRDARYVDVTLPLYEEWDILSRRMWRAAMLDANLAHLASPSPGTYTVHRAKAAALIALYRSFLQAEEEDQE